MANRVCTECSKPLDGKSPTAKTCSVSCRAKRSRRLKRIRSENGSKSRMPEHQRELTDRVEGSIPDVAHEVIEDEIRPVVRESITQDTLRAIGDMVALTPTAVAALQEDLYSEDAVVRQRAYTLLLKYTVGHSAIVKPEDEDRNQPLQVHFNLPRPESKQVEVEVQEVVNPGDDKTCDTCGETKPAEEFVAGSERCNDCFAVQKAREAELMAETDPST